MKTILLTGGSGFIGRNIQESYLSGKYNLIAPRHSELELMDEDAVNSFFKKNRIDIVLHAAAKPGHRNAKDPTQIFYTNTRIFFNLARNLDYFEKMIVTGSGAIYDMRHYQPKMQEDYFDTHVPVDEHGLSCYVRGKYIEASDRIIDLRIFGIFGKYEDYAIRFISNAICKAIFDLPISIKQNRKFDYIYIDDLMPVIDFFIQNKNKYKSYNVAPDNSIELQELAEYVRIISKKNLPIHIAQEGMGREYSGSNIRLRSEMDSLSYTSINDAIERLYLWYSSNSSINRNLLMVDK